MNKWAIGIGVLALIAAAVFAVINGSKSSSQIEYKYTPVTIGEVIRSTSATGTLVPLTQVDVKSKAGGIVTKLFVEEGSVVKEGDKIALIDPRDTQAAYDQASADLSAAEAKVQQSRTTASIEEQNAIQRVADAENNLALAKTKLAQVEETYKAQPVLAKADLGSALANLATAKEALRSLQEIQIPQTRKDAQGQFEKAKADFAAQQAELQRQQTLLKEGYVAQSAVDQQKTSLESSRATFLVAQQRLQTIETEIDSDLKTARAKVDQAQQALNQAKANQNRVPLSAADLKAARESVRSAEIALDQARTARLNVSLRREDIKSAQASAVRSRVAMDNARVQLNSTTVVAPRAGIVTTKYLEEGTIIPPGTSTFSQGTSLVQISDTTQMEVECLVDEADIASVKVGQKVRTILDAYPGDVFDGEVKRVFPSAATASSVTTIKVRVSIKGRTPESRSQSSGNGGGRREGAGARQEAGNGSNGDTSSADRGATGEHKRPPILRPGMNATCEFIQFAKENVVTVPQQAVQHEGDKAYVRVETADPLKPEKREVKVGATGNDNVEIVEGLKEGDKVVVAEIDLRAMRDRQAKMEQAQNSQGTLGSFNTKGPSKSRASGKGG